MPAAASEFRFQSRLRSRRARAERRDRRWKATMPPEDCLSGAATGTPANEPKPGVELVSVVQADHCKERFLHGVLKFKLGEHPVLHSRRAIDDNRRDRRQIDAAVMRLADAENPAGLLLQPFDIADALMGYAVVLRHDHQLSGKGKPVQYSNRRLGKPLPQIVVRHLCSCSSPRQIVTLSGGTSDAASTDQVRWKPDTRGLQGSICD